MGGIKASRRITTESLRARRGEGVKGWRQEGSHDPCRAECIRDEGKRHPGSEFTAEFAESAEGKGGRGGGMKASRHRGIRFTTEARRTRRWNGSPWLNGIRWWSFIWRVRIAMALTVPRTDHCKERGKTCDRRNPENDRRHRRAEGHGNPQDGHAEDYREAGDIDDRLAWCRHG